MDLCILHLYLYIFNEFWGLCLQQWCLCLRFGRTRYCHGLFGDFHGTPLVINWIGYDLILVLKSLVWWKEIASWDSVSSIILRIHYGCLHTFLGSLHYTGFPYHHSNPLNSNTFPSFFPQTHLHSTYSLTLLFQLHPIPSLPIKNLVYFTIPGRFMSPL